MLHSTVTSKGQTTLPAEIREAMGIQAGTKLSYEMQKDRIVVRVHPGIRSLAGRLASDKGRGMTFDQIRAAAAATRVSELHKSGRKS